MDNDKVEHGDLARDDISGFEGIVVALTIWINGCVRVTLAPQRLAPDGKIIDSHTFDSQHIVVLKKHVVSSNVREPSPGDTAAPPKSTGGPYPEPSHGM